MYLLFDILLWIEWIKLDSLNLALSLLFNLLNYEIEKSLIRSKEFKITAIDWNKILSPINLFERCKVKFTNVDDSFELKPFSFIFAFNW